ncbi:MAG: hypothetical protein ACNYPH_02395 [Gammaproteobacteria bacterium WSBS_2016_MAG_OTU1]
MSLLKATKKLTTAVLAGILASSPLAIAGETSQVNLSKCQRVSTDINAKDNLPHTYGV